ncbi:MAG: uracil-DNA glycosylase [Candidatus Neomarinimicrobiota bacterium]
MTNISQLNQELIRCRRCPRLVEFRETVAHEKRRQYVDWDYWGRPVPGYGAENARLIIVGLAPARHGGNRTGRVFTGDKSADFLVACLHRTGLANQPNSDSRDDGLVLNDSYMTPALKCVPPQDKPTAAELVNCFEWFRAELSALPEMRCVLALGKIAFDTCLKFWQDQLPLKRRDYPFSHGAVYHLPNGLRLVGAYHPSPRNVNTGRLTETMMLNLLEKVKGLVEK